MLSTQTSKVLGGTMLIAGTSIGAAMLAMPIMTGLFGYFGTIGIMLACWLFMYWTATLILEANLHFEREASFISMAHSTLGKWGAFVTWVFFLLLFYSLVATYLSGSGRIILDILEQLFFIKLPSFCELLPLLLLFAPFIYFGLSAVDHLNRYLVLGMIITYAAIVFFLVPHIQTQRLFYTNWSFSLLSFSVVVVSFGYHVIIPTLVSYFDRDVKQIKRCIFLGSIIPLIIYFVWEIAILGTVNVHGAYGFADAFNNDIPLAKLLHYQVNNDLISVFARGFSIFAIVTSFLGVAQGLFDFLKDGIQAKKSHKKRIIAFLLTFVPPIILIVGFESGFIALLEYAGALVSIILGIIPIMMVWQLRNKKNNNDVYRAWGGKPALLFGILFFVFVVLLVVLKNSGIINFHVKI